VSRGAVGAEDRAPKGQGVSMQLGSLGSSVSFSSESGRSPATKRYLMHFWSENALSGKVLNAARWFGRALSSRSGSGRSPAAKRHLVHFWSENSMQLSGLEERGKLPSAYERSSAAKRHLVHFGLKILYLARRWLATTYAW